MTKAGKKIIAGMAEALAVVRGEAQPARVTVRGCKLCPIVPGPITIAAMKAAGRGEFTGEFKTVDDLIAHLNDDEPDDA
jgi:hypothetical protein